MKILANGILFKSEAIKIFKLKIKIIYLFNENTQIIYSNSTESKILLIN